MNEFNKELEIINEFLEINQYNSIFPICDRILNDNFSSKEKAQIHFIMASAYKELEKYEDALVNYSSCIKLNNNKEYAYVRKSELLFKLNRFEAALGCCNRGLLIFEENTLLIKIKNKCEKQLCQFSMKDPIDTSSSVEDQVTAKPGNVEVAPIVKRRKVTILIAIVLISILVFLFAFFFAYRAYS